MWIDGLLQLSSAQAVTASAVSANCIDLNMARDLSAGEPLYVVITVDQTVTAAGAATVNFQAISGSGVGGGVINAGVTVLAQTGAIPKADLTYARRPIVLLVPRHVLTAQNFGQRYLGLQYTVTNGPLTAGQFTANVVNSPQDLDKLHGSGFGVA
ncbi:MAG: hypothetical protein K9J82_01130 [Methylotenera sp.]|jgi:hypothetical protein|nr:hypothetical protein [Methylotenera sp.]